MLELKFAICYRAASGASGLPGNDGYTETETRKEKKSR